jgi:hypothetical protein
MVIFEMMTPLDRKLNSEKFLMSLGISFADDLPPIESEETITLRSAEEIAERVLVLTYLNCVANDPSLQQQVMMFLIHEELWDKATETEKALFHKTQLSDDERTNILWRTESIWMLLWIIQKVDEINLPANEVDLYEIFPLLPGFFESTDDFKTRATLRAVSEILDQADLMFRLNWALRQEGAVVNSSAQMFHPGVAYERYFSLNWVAGMYAEWD